jgi:hypothetical protein
MAQLRGYLANEGAPKPVLWHRASSAFYELSAFIKWWNKLEKK